MPFPEPLTISEIMATAKARVSLWFPVVNPACPAPHNVS